MQIKTKLLRFSSFSAKRRATATPQMEVAAEPKALPVEELPNILPRSDEFVDQLDRQICLTYGQTIETISRALGRAGANPEKLIAFSKSARSRACFLMGCCAEELALFDGEYGPEKTCRFLQDVIGDLQPRVRPISARQVPTELRRLMVDFKSYPVRCRTMTVQYMLSSCGETDMVSMLRGNAVSQLMIELTVLHDGVSGTLRQLVEQASQTEWIPASDNLRPGTAMSLAVG